MPGRDVNGVMRMPKGRARFLLGKSCVECEVFLPASEFGIRTSGHHQSACKRCQSDRVTRKLQADTAYKSHFRSNVERRQRGLQKQSVDGRNSRKEWTGPELEIAARNDLTDKQKTEMLGRSFYAVRHMVRKLNGGDPVKSNLAGLSRKR